jgi:hypothetical protein
MGYLLRLEPVHDGDDSRILLFAEQLGDSTISGIFTQTG